MENKKRSTWTAITGNVSQAPCEDPKKTGQKALSQVKAIKEDAFIPKTPMAEDDE